MRLCGLVAALLLVATACSPGSTDAGDADSATVLDGFAACPATTVAGEKPRGPRLPDLSLQCMDGSGESFELRRPIGVPMVINLWGSWCRPCGKELPAFVELGRAAQGKLVVMGVVTEDSATRATEAARELGVAFPNLYDRSGELRRALGVNALPVTLFVDGAGELRKLYTGPVFDAASLREEVGRTLDVQLSAGR